VATMQLVDVNTWLPGDILVKADRMAMAHGLELRTPFLDREVLAVASRLARGAEGRPRLRAELERRGAPPDAVAAALDELPDDDLPAAREAARRWHGKSAAALARHLARKGFSRRAIFAVLKEHPGLSAEGADPDLA